MIRQGQWYTYSAETVPGRSDVIIRQISFRTTRLGPSESTTLLTGYEPEMQRVLDVYRRAVPAPRAISRGTKGDSDGDDGA